MTDQPEHQHSGKPEPDQVRPKKDVIRYCPVSRLPRFGEQIASELDKREFPGEIELALAEQIDALERRLCTTLIVYRSEVHEGVLQLCQMIDSDQLDNEALREVRALEESFGVWIVAYKTARTQDPTASQPATSASWDHSPIAKE